MLHRLQLRRRLPLLRLSQRRHPWQLLPRHPHQSRLRFQRKLLHLHLHLHQHLRLPLRQRRPICKRCLALPA